jgi:hypothetical protein
VSCAVFNAKAYADVGAYNATRPCNADGTWGNLETVDESECSAAVALLDKKNKDAADADRAAMITQRNQAYQAQTAALASVAVTNTSYNANNLRGSAKPSTAASASSTSTASSSTSASTTAAAAASTTSASTSSASITAKNKEEDEENWAEEFLNKLIEFFQKLGN